MKPDKGKKPLVMSDVSDGVSLECFSTFGEISFDAVLTFDRERRITYWNAAAERMYGWMTEEALGKTAEELFWSANTPQAMEEQQELRSRIEQGEIVRGEYRPCRKDGSLFWAEFVWRAIFDKAGEITGYLAIHRDITERKLSSAEIELNQKFVEDVALTTPNIIFIYDLNKDRVLYTNHMSRAILGYSWEDFNATQDLLATFIHPDDLERLSSQLRILASDSNGKVSGEYRVRTVNGSYRWLAVYATVFKSTSAGQVKQIIGTAVDITESRQIAEELRRSNAELRGQMNEMKELLEMLPIGVWIGNHDTSLITGNPAAYRILELEPGINASLTNLNPETPRGLRIFVEGKEVAPHDSPMQVVARTGKPMYNIEHEILFEDGKRKTVLTNIVPFFDEQGAVRKVIGAYVDLTDRKQNAERLARLQQVTAALSEAVTPEDVAHVIVDQGIPILHATSGSLLSLTDDDLALEMLYTSMPNAITRLYENFPLSRDIPSTHALRFETPVWIRSREEYKSRYPHMVETIEEWGLQGAAAIPLIVNDSKLGVLTMSFEQVTEFTVEDKDFILTLAQQAAQALDRAKLHKKVLQTLSELELTYNQSPIGIIQLDHQLRYRRVNETLARMNGIPVEDHIGRTMAEIVPNMASTLEDGLLKVMETGEPIYDIEIVGETLADPGVPHTWLEIWYPWRNEDGLVTGVNLVVQDITKRKRDEVALAEYARQQEALYHLADRLQRTDSLTDVFDAALEAVLSALQCSRGSILLFDESGVMRFVAWRGLSDAYRQATDGHSPWTPDEKNAAPIYYNDILDSDLSHELINTIRGEGIRSLAFIPLIFEEKLIGKFMVYFDVLHTFNEKELELSQTIAHQIAFGVQRKSTEELLHKERELLRELNETLEQKVQEQTVEIRTLASELTRAEQRERSRVARILHDDLQQRLYAIQIQVASLSDRSGKENERAQKDFARIKEQLQQAVLLTRHLSIDLSPPILHDEGLTQAVEWLASQMKKQYGLQVELQADESYANPDEDLRVLVFNCIRELLFNIVKHAEGSRSWVVLKRDNADLCVEVRDQGKGFDIAELPWQSLDAAQPQSFGLSTIYHQLSLFNGRMDVQSTPGQGTVVTITIPYP